MTPHDVRRLARSVPERWTELELVHRSVWIDVRATLRHGELDGVRLPGGEPIRERGAPPTCACCPLVFSEVSERLEHGEEWTAQPGELPDGVDLALDLEVGIVVSSRDRGGRRGGWFTNELLHVS